MGKFAAGMALFFFSVRNRTNSLRVFTKLPFATGSEFLNLSGLGNALSTDTATLHFSQGSAHTETLFYVPTTIVNSLGGDIELLGELWMLLLSISGLRPNKLSKALHRLGMTTGILGILTLYQDFQGIKEGFGVCQIIWFIWMGVALLGRDNNQPSNL